MNAHINYDLPQALIAVITPEDFGDAAADRRDADVTTSASTRCSSGRVAAEDGELERRRARATCSTGLLRR